jgi:hypothetical protein
MNIRDNMRVRVSHISGVEFGTIENAKDASRAIQFCMKVTVKMDDGTFCAFPIGWLEEVAETYYCVFCDNKVGNEKVCLNCNEYKGVVTEAEFNQFQLDYPRAI